MVTLGGSNWKVARGYFYSGEVLFFDLGGGYTDIFTFFLNPIMLYTYDSLLHICYFNKNLLIKKLFSYYKREVSYSFFSPSLI